MKLKHCLQILFCGCSLACASQTVAVKTNLVGDALLSPNVGIEFGLAPKWSLDVSGEINAWKLSHQRQWRHWYAMPEFRLWFCDRMDGHFMGLHLFGGQYNMGGFDGVLKYLGNDFRKLNESRYQGWFAGAGIGYGYAWALSRHFNIEAEIGIGWAYSRYDKFRCSGCGFKTENDRVHNYVGVTKAALNLEYVF